MDERFTSRKWLLALVPAILIASACGGPSPAGPGEGSPGGDAGGPLTVYSGRNEEFIGKLLQRFQQDTGIRLEVRYGDSAELAATIIEEGSNSPADVFISQDAGSLGAVGEAGLFAPIDQRVWNRVDRRFRSPQRLWVGLSGRARVAAYNTEKLSEDDLPDSITAFTEPEWKGRIGFPPTNGSFQAFVAAMILTDGEDATRQFLQGLVANDPVLFEDNSSTVRAVASGEIEVGFVNHYYKYEIEAEEGPIPVENHFFTGGDPGALVNTAGSGVLESSDQNEAATRLLDYMTGAIGQKYFAEETFEYPVVATHQPSVDLVPLEQIQSPAIDLSNLGESLEPALKLLADVGLV
jgi:iron(III) transport system substrate-binding protein